MATTSLPSAHSDIKFITLAREIAINHYEIEDILKHHSITNEEWDKIKTHPRFIELLQGEIVAWNAATNTHERTKLKAASIVEFWLEEANARLYSPGEALPAKVELAKLITRIAGMGLDRAQVEGGGGERFSVTINLGGDAQLKFEKQLPPQVIDAEVVNQ